MFRNWRAIANFNSGESALIVLGKSQYQINVTYAQALLEVINPDVQPYVKDVTVQKWRGKPNCGRWINVAKMKI